MGCHGYTSEECTDSGLGGCNQEWKWEKMEGRTGRCDMIGYKTESTLSAIRWCSGWGSGSPLMSTFTGSKPPLLATVLASL
jgi:hypothetical protein